MNAALIWRIQRLGHFVRRLRGSVALRGWHGTVRRLLQERSRLRTALFDESETAVVEAPLTDTLAAPHGRLLVVDTMTPDPERDSGSMRLCHMLELLHEDGWRIDLFPDDGHVTTADAARMARIGVHSSPRNLYRWLRDNGHALDAVLLCRAPIANHYLRLMRQLAPKATLVFDTVDLQYVRESRAAAVNGNQRLLRQAKRSRVHELRAISLSDVTLVVSEVERRCILQELPTSRVALLTNIHPLHERTQGYAGRRDLLFVGGFGHPPNADAMHWFVMSILPLLREQEPDICIHIVGDIGDSDRRALTRPGVIIHGRVENLQSLMTGCRLSVAPLRFGAGVKGKVNLAMSYGLPVVLTSLAAEGMHLHDRVEALIADDTIGFTQAVLELYRSPELWLRLSECGINNIRQHFSVELARDALRHIFKHEVTSPSSRRETAA